MEIINTLLIVVTSSVLGVLASLGTIKVIKWFYGY